MPNHPLTTVHLCASQPRRLTSIFPVLAAKCHALYQSFVRAKITLGFSCRAARASATLPSKTAWPGRWVELRKGERLGWGGVEFPLQGGDKVQWATVLMGW